MRVLTKLEDSRYLLIKAELEGTNFVYLKDKVQKTESLGIPERELDLTKLWERHRREEDFCLPCELLLLLKQKVVTAENSIAELGLTIERLEEFKKRLTQL